MAATSPYTGNDYQAVSNFRPYELPINDIFKAITAQNAFWQAGADRVKSVYDNALNLKLSLEPNKEIRKQYMQDAEKQLTKLSAMDLSDPSVQKQGFSIFKPLFQDEGIIYDDLTTRHYEKVRNDGAMYKSKDHGKEYSDINMQYAMQGYNEFINSKDRMAGKGAYENRKEYTPFYDYTEDFQKALKDCKPSSIETTSPNYGTNGAITGYMKESYSKTLSAAQVKGCLEAGLSTNGQRQLQIEGAVSYKNNLPVLASDTVSYLSGVTGNLSEQLQQLSATKAGIAARKDMSQADKAAAIKALDNQIKGTTEELDKTNHTVSKINAGDYTDIQNNYDTYAGSIYSYKKLYKKAIASSYEEIRSNYKADPVQLNAIKFSQDKYLRALDNKYDVDMETMKETHDKEMKYIDLMFGGTGKNGDPFKSADVFRNPLTGEITVNPNLLRETPNLTTAPEPNQKIYEQITGQVSALNEQDQNNNLRLYNNLISRAERDKDFRESLLKGFNYGVTDDEWTRFKNSSKNNRFAGINGDPSKMGGLQETGWFKAYTAQKPDDEDVTKWTYDNTVVNTGLQVLNRKIEIAEKQVTSELGGEKIAQITKKIAKLKPVVVDGITVTPDEISSALQGNQTGKVVIKTSPPWSDNEGNVHTGGYDYYVNGKKLDSSYFTTGAGSPTPFNQLRKGVEDASSSVINAINQKRVDVYNKLGFDREPWYFTPSNDKNPPRLVTTIKSLLPKDDKGKDLDVSVISSDFSGGIKITVPGVKKGGGDNYTDDVISRLRGKDTGSGVGTSIEVPADDVVVIRGTNYNLVPQAVNNPILAQAAYQLSTITETTAFEQTQPGAKVPNADITVPVMIRGKQEKLTIETYKSDNKPEYRVFVEGATTPTPKVIASNAYELFEKIGRLPMDFKKPVR